MKRQLIPILTTIFLVSVYAILQSSPTNAASDVYSPSRTDISYSKDVQPILEIRCGKCHMGDYPSEGLDMGIYETLMAGSQNGPVIVPGDANDSLLIEKVVEGEMPKRGPKLTSAQIQTLIDWINAGALNN